MSCWFNSLKGNSFYFLSWINGLIALTIKQFLQTREYEIRVFMGMNKTRG